jgi:hypothetical protein
VHEPVSNKKHIENLSKSSKTSYSKKIFLGVGEINF